MRIVYRQELVATRGDDVTDRTLRHHHALARIPLALAVERNMINDFLYRYKGSHTYVHTKKFKRQGTSNRQIAVSCDLSSGTVNFYVQRGITCMDDNTRLALIQLLEDRYGRRSTIIVSQDPLAQWHQVIDEPTLADAIMDRLSVSAHLKKLKGPSKRGKKSK